MAKSTFELASGEENIITDRVIWLRGGLKNAQGEAHLTNKRLVIVKESLIVVYLRLTIGGILGALIDMIASKFGSEVVLDLPFKDITHIEQTTYGFNKKTILIHTTSAGELKLSVRTAPEEWIKKFEAARKK